MPEKTVRFSVSLPLSLIVDFKKCAIEQMYTRSIGEQLEFSNKYVQLSTREALEMWVAVKHMDPKRIAKLNEIEIKEFGHIKDPKERHKIMWLLALDEFIENHSID
jgi:hypothetical protein